MMDWENKYLPEHLWLVSLVESLGQLDAARLYNRICDYLDLVYNPPADDPSVFIGFISDFSRFAEAELVKVRQTLTLDLELRHGFPDDLLNALTLYEDCPMAWLASGGAADVAVLRPLVGALRDPRSPSAVFARIMGINRLLKHEKLVFAPHIVDEKLADAIGRYPNNDAEMNARIEQKFRLVMNFVLESRTLTEWAPVFWRANFKLVETHEAI